MSHRWFYLRLALVLTAGSLSVAHAQFTGSVVKLGDSATGSVYRYTYNYNPTYWDPGQPGYGSQALSGIAGAYSANGVFPVGNSFAVAEADSANRIAGANSWTDKFTIPVGQTGVWVIATRPTGSNSYSSVTTDLGVSVAGTYVDGPDKQLSFKLPATGAVATTWQLVDANGNVVGFVKKDANSPEQIWTVDNLPTDADRSDYTLKFFLPGLKFDTDGGTWVGVTDPGDGSPGTATVLPSAVPNSGTGSGDILPKGTTPTAPQIGQVPTPTTIPSVPPAPPATGGTVWRAAGGGGGITDAVFKEGIDKLVNQAGDGAKVSAGILKAQSDGKAATDGTGASGTAAKAAAENAVGTAPTGTGYTLSSGGAPTLTVAMPSTFGGGTFDFNPFTSQRLLDVCQWFKAAVAWLVIAQLGAWVWTQLGEWVRGISTLPQAKGNPVVGGTGAQATAALAAGLMTVAVVTGITTLLAWSFGNINIPSLVAAVTTNPMATIPAGIFWMLDQVLPVATIISALVARITFNFYASAVFAGSAAVVRFIVP